MKRFARIRYRLLAFNTLLVFLPAAGMLFLDTYERQLLADQERTMVEQGRMLAATLSGRGALLEGDVAHTLEQLAQRSEARIRVIDPSGRVLADSSRAGARPEPSAAPLPASSPSPRSSWLYRVGSLPFRLYRRLLAPPEPPHTSADVYAGGEPLLGPEVRAALAGRYGAATRISSGGQRSVTLYSALPIREGGRVVGAVLISRSTFRILQALYAVRGDVFRVFLASLAAAVVLSLLVSRTIAAPLSRLRDEAEALLDRRGRMQGRFLVPRTRDEIGDLAHSLEALRARLESHIREIERFASDVSHEFKNPLASIRTATELIQEVESPEERQKFVEMIERDAVRMEHLLADVRELSRVDAPTEGDERERVELGGLLEAIVEAQRLRGAAPIRYARPEREAPVFASPERLIQVLENVLDNATSFSPPGAPVEIELEIRGGLARIRVLDHGPGIPAAHRERIFDRFFSYRPDDPRAGRSHSGLGLSIARAIAENAGGGLEVGNRSGGGTCCEIHLPLDPGRA